MRELGRVPVSCPSGQLETHIVGTGIDEHHVTCLGVLPEKCFVNLDGRNGQLGRTRRGVVGQHAGVLTEERCCGSHSIVSNSVILRRMAEPPSPGLSGDLDLSCSSGSSPAAGKTRQS